MGEPFDREAVSHRFGGDGDLLGQIAHLFRDSARGWLDEIRADQGRGDFAHLKRVAHTLKGSVTNFLARDAAAAALRVERSASAPNADDLNQAIAVLDAEVQRLTAALEVLVAAMGKGECAS
jgi:two-component system, sensor histidine kinase and response regulator